MTPQDLLDRQELISRAERSDLRVAPRLAAELRSLELPAYRCPSVDTHRLINIYERRRRRLSADTVLARQIDAWLEALRGRETVRLVSVEDATDPLALLISEDRSELLAAIWPRATIDP